jgi:hypothetical protein
MKDIDKFKGKVILYREGWNSLDIKTVCFLAYEKWINIGTRIILTRHTATKPTNKTILPLYVRLFSNGD